MNEEGISSKDVYYEGCLDGQMAERAAIVSWLGTEACYNTLRSHEWNLADALERGEHLRSNDE